MRVLHVASGDLWAGAEVQLSILAAHQVQYPELKVYAFLLNEGQLAQQLRRSGVTVEVCEESSRGFFTLFVALCRYVKSIEPHIVHTHRRKENLLGSLAACISDEAVSLRTVHGLAEPASSRRQSFRRRCADVLDRLAGDYLQKAAIAVSRDLAQAAIAQFRRTAIVAIPNGIDEARVRAVPPLLGLRDAVGAKLHVGLVGRLVEVKRPDLFLKIAKECRRRFGEELHFHVVGDGPLMEAMVQEAVRDHLMPVVTFHGHRHDAVACIAALDAVIICSDHEGMPMAALESLSAGVTVIAHAVGGLTEIIAPKWLVSDQDPQGYADLLATMLREPLGWVARPRDSLLPTGFTAAANARATVMLYQNLLDRNVN
jgi:glycosyltransferase involved in cell wall biosynthesis